MRVRLPAMMAALLLPMTLASPAGAAPGDKHGSCRDLGQSFKVWAQGDVYPGTPGTVMPVLAQSEPGFVAFVVHAEMAEGTPDPDDEPFCAPHPRGK